MWSYGDNIAENELSCQMTKIVKLELWLLKETWLLWNTSLLGKPFKLASMIVSHKGLMSLMCYVIQDPKNVLCVCIPKREIRNNFFWNYSFFNIP